MIRPPVVAGMFYPAAAEELLNEVQLLSAPEGETAEKIKPLMVMLPHAGYIYSGRVAGLTLSRVQLPETLILLGPCHRIRGSGFSVWANGSWATPLGNVPVNSDLASTIISSDASFAAEEAPHSQEHSLEVLLPFLKVAQPNLNIVPIAVSDPNPARLRVAALTLANIINSFKQSGKEPPCLVVSSDMNHFANAEAGKKLDHMALEAALDIDGERLYKVVSENNISMCGVLPASIALGACKALGATTAQLVKYAHSGMVTGDNSRVVGYAGMIVF